MTDLNDMQRELARDTRSGLDEMATELLACLPPATVVDVLFGAAVTLGDDQLGPIAADALPARPGRRDSERWD